MADLGRTVQEESGATRPATDEDHGSGSEAGDRRARTAGTDRDFDESGESANQGHGHPRDERERSDDAGRSPDRVTETDREQRDLGGPGG